VVLAVDEADAADGGPVRLALTGTPVDPV